MRQADFRKAWQAVAGSSESATDKKAVLWLIERGSLKAVQARLILELHHAHILPAAQAIASLVHEPRGNSEDVYKSVSQAYHDIRVATERVQCLCDTLKGHCETENIQLEFSLRWRATLQEKVPRRLSNILHTEILRVFDESTSLVHRKPDADSSLKMCPDFFLTLCTQLSVLGFSDALQEAIGWFLFALIDAKVSRYAASNLETRALPVIQHWAGNSLSAWLRQLQTAVEYSDNCMGCSTTQYRELHSRRIAFHLHEALAGARIASILDIVAEFPKTLPAIEDLKECLVHTDKKPQLIQSLRLQFSTKLLHAGTMTSDILQQYINMIKALQYLDPSGVILESVSDPVRSCLRRRPDTVRCIVSGMTGDGDLYQELQRIGSSVSSGRKQSSPIGALSQDRAEEALSDAGDDSEADEIDPEEFDHWEPEPIDAPIRSGRWRPGADAIATLVAIYGSSEQIVTEYRSLLADKLVSNFELDLEREFRVLELLQQRFGVDAMHDCSIMLKDMQDSLEIAKTARLEAPKAAEKLKNFETTVISKEFWPQFAEEPSFKAPPELVVCMDQFGASFERLKEPRKLRWQNGVGVVQLSVAFQDGRALDLTLSPLQAAIVLRFASKSRWRVKELQEDLEVKDDSAFRRRLVLLANQDVIQATDGSASTYETIERADELDGSGGVVDVESTESLAISEDVEDAKSKEEAEMAMFETYIMAMLRNLKALPLERIHMMLQMVVKTPAYDKTQSQLAAFLAKLVADDKLELHAGVYKVRK